VGTEVKVGEVFRNMVIMLKVMRYETKKDARNVNCESGKDLVGRIMGYLNALRRVYSIEMLLDTVLDYLYHRLLGRLENFLLFPSARAQQAYTFKNILAGIQASKYKGLTPRF
jgi:hypothetical protein